MAEERKRRMKSRQTPLSNRFVDPGILHTLGNLQLIAKTVVEGFVSGLHRSPYHGFSLEFAEYREYSPGDDIRRVDWKVYGRSDRFYVKKFEGETNTRLYILMDTSRSMSFGSHSLTKLDYARYIAASLAFFAVRQKDAVGLLDFDSAVRSYTPPRQRHGHLLKILQHLEGIETGENTDICAALEELARIIRKRSLVVLISDLYQPAQDLARALRFFHHRGNDVILFHVLDPMELEMSLPEMTTLEDMETGEQLPYISQYSRQAYLELLKRHIADLRRECFNVKIDYQVLNTEKPLDQAMHTYLSVRAKRV